ncbi:HupE/UreJ family protein [Hydrotalea sp.]|uniref:HupE/UreJ family protein n=1 Tax=Hydrotalea sp. TaxID=2881279 RepID=UPI003D0EB9AD
MFIKASNTHLYKIATIYRYFLVNTNVGIIFIAMSDFNLYFTLGRQHIANITALDHILFLAALCTRYQFSDWKKLLVLVTAFTIGHSITLALSVLNVIHFSTAWIEFLIPITIFITAFSNLFVKKFVFKSKFPIIYFFALFFGLVHGLGFSNYLKSLLGKNENIIWQLFAFNCGLEIGQLIIVLIILIIAFILVSILKISRRDYLLFLSAAIIALSLEMCFQRLPFHI